MTPSCFGCHSFFSMDAIHDFAALLKSYRVSRVTGDRAERDEVVAA